MPSITVKKTYASGVLPTERQIDNIKNSIETFVNITQIDDDNIQTGGVGTTSIADEAVTRAKLASVTIQASAGDEQDGTTSGSFSDIPGMSISITTTGRPVIVAIGMASDSFSTESYLGAETLTSTNTSEGDFRILRGATSVGVARVLMIYSNNSSSHKLIIPGSACFAIDVVAAGTYTYKLQFRQNVASQSAPTSNIKLRAFEMR